MVPGNHFSVTCDVQCYKECPFHPPTPLLGWDHNGERALKAAACHVTLLKIIISLIICSTAGPIGRAVSGVGLGPLACSDRGFESRREHGCLSVVSVVWCQVEVSATS